MVFEEKGKTSTKTQSNMRVVALIFLCFLMSSTWAENELGDLLDAARSRMRCGSDPKCLEKKGIERLLRVTNLKNADRENLSLILAHHFLHGDFSCTTKLSNLGIVEIEVMRAIEMEDISGILRIFKRILKDGGKKECIGTDRILREMSQPPNPSAVLWVRSVLTVLMDHVLKGYCLADGLPTGDSLDDLFSNYGDACSPYISAQGLEKMMDDLESSGHAHNRHHHDHDHDHPHHAGHSHLHECDHHHHDHDHDHPDSYHSDHIHLSHNHNDDQSDNYLRNSNHSHNDDYSHHNHYDTDGHDHHNHSDHDHGHHSQRDHEQPSHSYPSVGNSPNYELNHGVDVDGQKNQSHQDHNKGNLNLQSFISANNGALNTTVNVTSEQEKDVKNQSISSEILSEAAEPILSANLWHPTTLASEESNVVSHIIPPLNAYASTSPQCMSAESLVSHYGSDRISLSKNEFMSLCPVIIQQRVGEACAEPLISLNTPSKAEVYGYGFASVAVLCLTSLAGIFLYPLMKMNVRHYVIAGFQGLAFSTLAADALLHLIPEFLGLHSHSHTQEHSHDEAFPEPYTQRLLGFFATTYILFLIEAIPCAMSSRSKPSGHSHGHSHVHHLTEPTLISVKSKATTDSTTQLPMSVGQSCSSLDTEIVDIDSIKKPPNLMVSKPLIWGLTSTALVITFGDALHNFGDGLAMGAAFSANIRGGLSTAAAALCHEIPHELGDFVVLLSTGLSYSRALILNFLSGLTCLAGLYVGILMGDNDEARMWVMAVAASTFLYVALAVMIPELREHRHGSPYIMLLVKNIGIILGLGIMLIISIYEHNMA